MVSMFNNGRSSGTKALGTRRRRRVVMQEEDAGYYLGVTVETFVEA